MNEEEIVVTKKKHRPNRRTKQQLESLGDMRTFEQEKMKNTKQVFKMIVEDDVQNNDSDKQFQMNQNDINNKNSDQLIETLNNLLAKKKINAKNSFDVPMIEIDLEKDYKNLQTNENWNKISLIFNIDTSIYSYRSEHIHNESYRVMTQINRQQKNDSVLEPQNQNSFDIGQEIEITKSNGDCGKRTLELKKDSINMNWGKFMANTGSNMGELKFSQLNSNEKINKFSNFYQLNQRLQMEIDDQNLENVVFNTKKDKEHSIKEINLPQRIDFIEDITKAKKKVNKLCSHHDQQPIFQNSPWNFNITLQPVEILLRNLPILDQYPEQEGFDHEVQNYHHNILQTELQQIKQHIEKKNNKLNLTKIQEKQSLLGVGVKVFKQDAEKWMSSTDLRFTNMVFERDHIDKPEESNTNCIQFDEEEQNWYDVIEPISKQINLLSDTKYLDYHLAPQSQYASLNLFNSFSMRPVLFEQQLEHQEQKVHEAQQGMEQDDGVDSSLEEAKQKQGIKAHHTMSEIQNYIFPIIVSEPEPKSLMQCYRKAVRSAPKFNNLEFKVFFAAVVYLGSSKGVMIEPVNLKHRVPTDYVITISAQ